MLSSTQASSDLEIVIFLLSFFFFTFYDVQTLLRNWAVIHFFLS